MSEPAPAVEPSATAPPDELPKFDETKTHENIDIGFTVDAGGAPAEQVAAELAALEGVDLTGTSVAIFGLGDAAGYPENFVDGLGLLYERLVDVPSKAVGGLKVTVWVLEA